MKKLYLLFCLLAMAGVSHAQFNVTLQVDLTNEEVTGDVFVAGSFQGWEAGVADYIMTDDDGDNIYEITLALDDGDHEFKFINGEDWESIPAACASDDGNRAVNVSGADVVVDPVCFATCDAVCQDLSAVTVTFRLDMSNEDVTGEVHVAGSFQGWTPEAADGELTDDDGDGIYELTTTINTGTYQYKFLNGNMWGTEESIPCDCNFGGNREITIEESGMIDVVCFGACSADCFSTQAIDVTFKVDMSNEILGPGGLFVGGEIENPAWQKNVIQLTDDDVDFIYEATVAVTPGEYQYKFFNGDFELSPDPANTDFYAEDPSPGFGDGGCGCPGGFNNRLLDVKFADNNVTLPTYVYNSCQTLVNVKELSTATAIRTYPTPARTRAYIEFENATAVDHGVVLTNMTGQVVNSLAPTSDNIMTIERNGLPAGMYFATITNDLGEQATVKVIFR